MMRWVWAVLVLAASPVFGQSISGQQAESVLFGTNGESIQVDPELSDRDQAIIRRIVELSGSQFGQQLYYYGSIAWSPDEGLISDALQSSANHHGVVAADTAALNACNAARSDGTQACRIAARILPAGYESRSFELSFGATEAFLASYRRINGEKALAISALTGQFAVNSGANAVQQAIDACNNLSRGANDCRAAIVN